MYVCTKRKLNSVETDAKGRRHEFDSGIICICNNKLLLMQLSNLMHTLGPKYFYSILAFV